MLRSSDRFIVRCSIGNCLNSYSSFSAFNSHIYSHHHQEVCRGSYKPGITANSASVSLDDFPSVSKDSINLHGAGDIVTNDTGMQDTPEPLIKDDVAQLLGEDGHRESACVPY